MRTFAKNENRPAPPASAPRARSSRALSGSPVHSRFGGGFSTRPMSAGQGWTGRAPRTMAALGESGQPLDSGTRQFMEARFGHDFGAVRVHADARAAESAEALGARAYTVGNHIVLGRDPAPPESVAGRRLFAHELAHVVQQSRDARPPAIDPGAPHEQEARAAATAVALGLPSIQIRCHTGVGVARDEKNLPLTDVSKEDPRTWPRYIDNVFQGVTFYGLNGAFAFDWVENGKKQQVTIPLAAVDQDDTRNFVPVFDVYKTKDEALLADYHKLLEFAGLGWRFYSFYVRPDGIVMPTVFSINSTPKFHAMWPDLKKGIAEKAKDISEGLRTMANAINPIPGTTVDENGNLSLSSNPLDWLALIHLLHARRLSKIPEEGPIKTKLHSGYDVPYTVVGPHDKLTGTSVYVLKDAEGTVLYVGKGDALDRLREHIKDPKKTQWFGEIAQVEVPATGLTNTQALALEEDLVGQLKPLYNIDRTPFKSVFGTTMEVGPNLPKPQKPLTFALHWGH